MNRTTRPVALVIATSLAVAACGGGDDETAPTTEPSTTAAPTTTQAPTTTAATTTTTPASTTTTVPDVLRMPLTGEPLDDADEIPDRPALVVKISNYPPSVIPQAGLNDADIVIHEIINDGATRLAAIFHSHQADPVGPIRSGRAQDINLLRAFDRPLFAWSGGNAMVTRAVADSDLVDLNAIRSSGYYRRPGRRSPNDLYSSTDVLWDQATEDAGRPPQVFQYLPEGEEPGGAPATTIELRLDQTEVRWEWDEDAGRYLRWQGGVEHETEQDGDEVQVWTDNIVVMTADYGVNSFDGNPDAQVLGSNPVYVFSGGTVRVGEWLRFEATDPFGLFTDTTDLDPIPLLAGRTWLEIPRNVEGSITFE